MLLSLSCDVAWWKRGSNFRAVSRSFLGVPSYLSSKKRFGRCLESPNPLMNFVFDVPKLDETGGSASGCECSALRVSQPLSLCAFQGYLSIEESIPPGTSGEVFLIPGGI